MRRGRRADERAKRSSTGSAAIVGAAPRKVRATGADSGDVGHPSGVPPYIIPSKAAGGIGVSTSDPPSHMRVISTRWLASASASCRGHLSDQPVAAFRGAADRVAVGLMPADADSQRRALCRVLRNAGRLRRQRLAQRFLRVGGWSVRDAADQRHDAARLRPRTRWPARPGAVERQGPRREPDDRRSDAQRSVARLQRGHRARAGTVRARAYATVHHLVSTVVGELAPGHDALDLVRAAFLVDRLPERRRSGPWKSSLEPSAQRVLRVDWVLQRHRRARHEHCDPDGYRAGGPRSRVFQRRRRHRGRFGPRAGDAARRSTRPVA